MAMIIVTKKFWKSIRNSCFVLRKEITKSILLSDLILLVKQSKLAVRNRIFQKQQSDLDFVISGSAVSSPAIGLPGFGRTPVVRQLRITDSPFPATETEDEEDGGRVDRAAEEFIRRFYRELRHQNSIYYES